MGNEITVATQAFNQSMAIATDFQHQKETGVEAYNRDYLHEIFTNYVGRAARFAKMAHIIDVGYVDTYNSTDKYFILLKYVS